MNNQSTHGSAAVRRVVVAGANSPTGRLLLMLLRDADVHVTALVRQPARLFADEVVADWTRSERAFEVIAAADAVVLLTGASPADDWDACRRSMVAPAERVATVISKLGNRDTRVIYFSALGADAADPHCYLRAKGLAEQTLARLRNTVIFRIGPVVRGSPHPLPFELSLQQQAPGRPVFVNGNTGQRSRPINLADVATIAEAAALGAGDAGIYELGGPDEHTLAELVQLVNGREVPVSIVETGSTLIRCPASAAMMALLARTGVSDDAAVAINATAAHFGVQLTPLSLAWPLDEPEGFEPAVSISTAGGRLPQVAEYLGGGSRDAWRDDDVAACGLSP